MRRTPIRRQSSKARKRAAEAKPVRTYLIAESKACMICGASERNLKHHPRETNQLCCHEIANGPYRQKALDQPYAILVLCWHCNQHEVEDKAKWPEARQLALLRDRMSANYDLTAYNHLINPNAPRRIEPHEVDAYAESVLPGRLRQGTC